MNVSRISEAAVKNWQFTVVVTTMVVAMGANAWFSVPRAEDPTFPIAIYPIVAVYPGASPADIERLVVEPIEEAVGELEDLNTLETQVEDGVAVIRAEFEAGVDADRKYEEVLREVNTLRPALPADLHSLEVERTSAADVNIVQTALVSEAVPYRILQDEAKRLQDRIGRVAGVRDAEVWGAPEREVRVNLDLGRTAQLGIAPAQVLAAVGSESANIPGGSVDAATRRFNVKTSGDYTSVDDVRATVVGGAAGSVVQLRDVADVRWGYADPTHVARFNGRRAVFITANMQEGNNISRVREGIYRELAALPGLLHRPGAPGHPGDVQAPPARRGAPRRPAGVRPRGPPPGARDGLTIQTASHTETRRHRGETLILLLRVSA